MKDGDAGQRAMGLKDYWGNFAGLGEERNFDSKTEPPKNKPRRFAGLLRQVIVGLR